MTDDELLAGLDVAAAELSAIASPEAIASVLADVAAAIPGVRDAEVHLVDDAASALRPVASTLDGSGDPVPGDSLAAVARECYFAADPVVHEENTSNGDESGPVLAHPLGGFGSLVVIPSDVAVPDRVRTTVSILATVARTRLERGEAERELGRRTRERDGCTETLSRAADAMGLVFGLERVVADAESRSVLEQVVCERLAGLERVALAWVGRPDAAGQRLVSAAAAGREQPYLEAVDRTFTPSNTEPAVVTARNRETTTVDSVATRLGTAAWRREAHARGVEAVRAVPLVVDGRFDGVLAVYTVDDSAASDLWGRMLEHVANVAAHGLGSLNRKRALLSDALVEMELELAGGDDLFGRLAREVGTDLRLDGITAHGGETALFLATPGRDSAGVESAIARDPAVASVQSVRRDDGDLLEVVVREEWLLSYFVDAGATPQAIEATAEGTRVVLTVPTTVDVEEFVGSLEHYYDEVVLRSRRERTRPVAREQHVWAELEESLTDRQLETLRTAFLRGYFEWPRESTGEEVASLLDISQPTFSRHLRTAERKLLSLLFDSERG